MRERDTMWTVLRRTLAIVALLGLAACSGAPRALTDCPTGAVVPLRIGPEENALMLRVEIADEGDERATGLMGRSTLPDGRGMAFLYDEPVDGGFWMKDTTIPLSIAFWGEDGRISDVLDMDPCTEDPCTVYEPARPFVGAVEVGQGSLGEAGVGVGDPVEIDVENCA